MLNFQCTGKNPKRFSCPARGKTDLVRKRVANVIDVQCGGQMYQKGVRLCVRVDLLKTWAVSRGSFCCPPHPAPGADCQESSPAGLSHKKGKGHSRSHSELDQLCPPRYAHARATCPESVRHRTQAEGTPRRARPSLSEDIPALGHRPKFPNHMQACSLF